MSKQGQPTEQRTADEVYWLVYAPLDDTVVPGRYLPQAGTTDGDRVQGRGALVSLFSLLTLVSIALLVVTP